MRNIRDVISSLAKQRKGRWKIYKNRLHIVLGKTNRTQNITLSFDGDYYALTSVILRSSDVRRTVKRQCELARIAWHLNADQEIVSYGFDKINHFVGQIRHPAKYLDPEELELYIDVLARECDRLEYLLSGKDVN